MPLAALVLLFAAALAPAVRAQQPASQEPAPAEDSFDPAQYPASSVEEVLASARCGKQDSVRDLPFSSELVYQGELRKASPERRGLLRRWARSLDAEEQADAFDRELRLSDGKKTLWIPVAASLVAYLDRELARGDRAVFYMSYVGCAAGEPVLAVEEFSIPGYYEDLEEESGSYIA